MNDRVDLVFADEPCHQRLIASFTDNERHAVGHSPTVSSGEIVEYHDVFASVTELMHHLAADITRTARNQDRHSLPRFGFLIAANFLFGIA